MKHDLRSREDGKMRWFLRRAGMEGYGAFWATLEKLSYQNDNTIPLDGPEFEGIAEDLQLDTKRYFEILQQAAAAGLFVMKNGRLWQEKLKQDEAERSRTKQNAGRLGGLKSGAARRAQKNSASEANADNLAEADDSAKQDEAALEAAKQTKLDRKKERKRDHYNTGANALSLAKLKVDPPDGNGNNPDLPKCLVEFFTSQGKEEQFPNVWLTETELLALFERYGEETVNKAGFEMTRWSRSIDLSPTNGKPGWLSYRLKRDHAATLRNLIERRANGK